MANLKVPYLITKKGAKGQPMRHYWQPSAKLAQQGWNTLRLDDDPALAIQEARAQNLKLAAWKLGQGTGQVAGQGGPITGTLPPPRQSKNHTGHLLTDVIKLYLAAPEFTKLAAKTREEYARILKPDGAIQAWAGDQPVEALTKPLVFQFYKARMKRAHAQANAELRVLRLVLNWMIREFGWIEINPAETLRMISVPPRQQIWSDQQILTMIATADDLGRPSIATALLLAARTGQRQGDILKMTRNQIDVGRIQLQQGKTAKWVDIPFTQDLVKRLDDIAQQSPKLVHLHLVTAEHNNQPYQKSHFAHSFLKIRQEAMRRYPELNAAQDPHDPSNRHWSKLQDLQFLDLRRTCIVRLAEAKCTIPEIAAISGHEIDECTKILETYLPRTGEMASAAIAKFELKNDENRQKHTAPKHRSTGEKVNGAKT